MLSEFDPNLSAVKGAVKLKQTSPAQSGEIKLQVIGHSDLLRDPKKLYYITT